MAEFKIQITSDAQQAVSAAQQTSQALAGTADAVKKAAGEAERYQQTLQRMAEQAGVQKKVSEEDQVLLEKSAALKQKVREATERRTAAETAFAQAQKEGSAATDDAGKKAEFLSLKIGDLHKLTSALTREFPLAGYAARAMMNPITAALTGAISIFAIAKRRLEEWNAEMDQASARAASPDFAAGMEAKKTALQEAATQAEAFALSIEAIGMAEDKLRNSTTQAIAKLHEFTAAQGAVDSAEQARDLAAVDLAQKTGRLSESGAAGARATIRERYARKADELKTKAENDELQLQQAELEAQRKGLPGLAEASADARKMRDETQAKAKQAAADLQAGRAKEAEYDAALIKAEEAVANARPGYDRAMRGARAIGLSEPPAGQADRMRFEEASQALEAARANKSRQQGLNAWNQSFLGDAAGVMPQLDSQAALADRRFQTSAGRIAELETAIPGRAASVGVAQLGRAVAGDLRRESAQMGSASEMSAILARGQQEEARMREEIARTAESGNSVREAMIQALRAIQEENARTAWELRSQLGNMR